MSIVTIFSRNTNYKQNFYCALVFVFFPVDGFPIDKKEILSLRMRVPTVNFFIYVYFYWD